MRERRFVEEGRATDATRVVIGGEKGGSGADPLEKPSPWARHKHAAGCLLTFLLVLPGCLVLAAADPSIGSGEATPTLQNQKIYCWGYSAELGIGAQEGEEYTDHLGRLLGREVDHPTGMNFGAPPDMMPPTLNDILVAVPYFEEHKYGVIIMSGAFRTLKIAEPGELGTLRPLMEVPWDVVEDYVRKVIRGLQDTGAVVVFLERETMWNVSGQLTMIDDAEGELCPSYIVYGPIGNETRAAKYNEWWGESVFCRIAREEGAYFISDSVFDCLEETDEYCPPGTWFLLSTRLMGAGSGHPNGMGYGVWAEQLARHLVGWGLAEYAVDMDKLSQDLTVDLADVREMIKVQEERNHPLTEELEKEYRMVELVYSKGFLYTANRTLVGSVLSRIAPVYENWDEVHGMFDAANASIKALEQEGIDTARMRCDYAAAQTYWQGYQHEQTNTSLTKIVTNAGRYLDALPEISGMFSRASDVIEDARNKGADTQQMDRSFNRAKIYWGQYEVERTREELLKILATDLLPLPPILGLALLVALSRSRPRKDSPGATMTGSRPPRPDLGMMQNE